jgi:hypothetical protein
MTYGNDLIWFETEQYFKHFNLGLWFYFEGDYGYLEIGFGPWNLTIHIGGQE